MAGWNRLICWLARARAALIRWHHGRVIKWESRYIDQYRKQIDDALEGIVIAKKRRAAAEARRR